MKKCKGCNKIKRFSDFHKCGKYYQSNCKICKKEYDKKIRLRNKEKIAIKGQEYWKGLTYEQKRDHNLNKIYVNVRCNDCNIEFKKRKDSLKRWKGRCNICSKKEIANRPEMRKIYTQNGLNYFKRFGKLPKAKIENRRRGKNHPMWRVSRKGKDSPNWRGGVTSENVLERHSFKYRLWREAIFKADNYTCVACQDNKGGNLNADHIKPFSLFPELRFDINNGRTLCKKCHDKYGAKVNSKGKLLKEAIIIE